MINEYKILEEQMREEKEQELVARKKEEYLEKSRDLIKTKIYEILERMKEKREQELFAQRKEEYIEKLRKQGMIK